MARSFFGGSDSSALAVQAPSANGGVVKSAPNITGGTAWSTRTGGTQYSVVTPLGAATTVCTDADGFIIRMQGPDGVNESMWVDLGSGVRFLLRTTDSIAGQTTGAAGGNLSGTYPNPVVAKINGVAVTGTPSVGQVPTATSGTAATWQTPTIVGAPISVNGAREGNTALASLLTGLASLGLITDNTVAVSPGAIYGAGIGYDTKANIPIGPNKAAIRFKASTSSALNSVRWVQRGGSGGYSLGTGGTITISVQADDGAGHPSGTSLASLTYTPGNPAGTWETYLQHTFPTPATLVAGTTYYIVFTNPSTTNYMSVNNVLTYNAVVPRQPVFLDASYGLLQVAAGSAWGALETNYTPVVDLTYANGVHDGQAYYEAMILNYATINDVTSMARQTITVSGGNRTVDGAAVRVRRTSGTADLILTLETAGGSIIDTAAIPAANVPVSTPGGDTGGAVWVTGAFAGPHLLTNGSSYNLRLSTASGTTYTTFPVRAGTDKGFNSYVFPDGKGQYSTNANAATPTWTDLYAFSHTDLQFYLTLA